MIKSFDSNISPPASSADEPGNGYLAIRTLRTLRLLTPLGLLLGQLTLQSPPQPRRDRTGRVTAGRS